MEGVSIWNLFTDGQLGDRAAIESRSDVLVYSTPVLERDVEVTGTIEAVLHAASSAPDTDFIINLIDVYPDGHTQYLCNGVIRVTYRDGLGERKLIEPDRIYEYRFSLRPISNCFLKGHSIRIEVTSSDMDRYARNHRQCGDCRADHPPWRRHALASGAAGDPTGITLHHQPGITLRWGSGVSKRVANQYSRSRSPTGTISNSKEASLDNINPCRNTIELMMLIANPSHHSRRSCLSGRPRGTIRFTQICWAASTIT